MILKGIPQSGIQIPLSWWKSNRCSGTKRYFEQNQSKVLIVTLSYHSTPPAVCRCVCLQISLTNILAPGLDLKCDWIPFLVNTNCVNTTFICSWYLVLVQNAPVVNYLTTPVAFLLLLIESPIEGAIKHEQPITLDLSQIPTLCKRQLLNVHARLARDQTSKQHDAPHSTTTACLKSICDKVSNNR